MRFEGYVQRFLTSTIGGGHETRIGVIGATIRDVGDTSLPPTLEDPLDLPSNVLGLVEHLQVTSLSQESCRGPVS